MNGKGSNHSKRINPEKYYNSNFWKKDRPTNSSTNIKIQESKKIIKK